MKGLAMRGLAAARRDWIGHGRRIGRRLNEQLGLVGWTGIGLLMLAAVLGLYAPPLARQAQDLHASAERTRGMLEEARQQLAHQPVSSRQAAQLRAWFPTIDRANADLRLVFDAAQRTHIELAKGDYALANVADASRLQRFEVVLPVKDRYVTIKTFVAEVLKALPHASLAELRIERGAANVETLDARLRFTLFYRTP
jgi:hypothetical protein